VSTAAVTTPATLAPAAKLAGTTAHDNWALLGRLLGLGWRYRLECLRILVQQVLLIILQMFQLGLAGLGIDVIRWEMTNRSGANPWPFGWIPGSEWTRWELILAISVTIVISASLHAFLRFRATVVMTRLAQQRIVYQLRTDVYDKLQRLSFRFFDANQSGSIINRVAGDVQAVRMFVDGVLIQVITVIISLGIYLSYMISLQPLLTLACLATTPFLWIGAAIFSKLVRPAYQENSKLIDRVMLVLSENIQGQAVVKGFGRAAAECQKFDVATDSVQQQKYGIFTIVSWFQPIMGILTQINMLVLLGFGGYLVIQGQFALGTGLFVFANLLTQFANQVAQITNIANSIQASLTGAERVFEILDAPLEVAQPLKPYRPEKVLGAIRYEDVSFHYNAGVEVLRDVTFAVEPGQCVAIVGATGTGKSTLMSLLPRFYDTTKGRVLVDGIDVRDWDLDRLRRSVGLVFQETFLFSNTVAANIAFGKPDATREEIQRAAKIAAADNFITELPQGYDTIIGEYGSNLSGGQRQRLAIARAVLLEPPILILDDALAAVDPETEGEILQAMENAMTGRTTFVIAHRLSTLRRADLVLVMKDGRIVQRGTHEELLAIEGHYREVAELQGKQLPVADSRGAQP
jgi:ABC-type multidrug transport system fused ATPase/permease subunit